MNNNNKSCCKKSLFRRGLCVIQLAFLFLSPGMWTANAAAALPKATHLSIQAKNKPIKEILAEIEKKTEYIFFYSNDIVDVDRKVSVDVNNGTVETVLNQIFRATDNSYEIKDRQIFIVKTEKQAAEKSEPARRQSGTKRITGTITDTKGTPLAGVNVIVKGTTIGVSSNIDGTYVIDVPMNSSLTYSYIGYLNQEITPGAESICNIVLNEDNRVMEEVVVVGFGQQKKESVIGAIQSFKTSDMKMPAANLTNSFAGRIAGVISVQQSGEPGADGANFWIRGVSTFAEAAQNPLILIDGVECSSYDLNALAPEVIENFSILKDATATALYGSRGANGVMIVTTKTGQGGKPKINLRVEGRMSMPTQIPELADGVQYMRMFNEAIEARTPGAEPKFSEEAIQGTINKLNPYVYPNVNWYKELFKQQTYTQAVNLNVSGGIAKRVTYFMSASITNESGLLKQAPENPFKNNIHNLRYSFQSNVSSQLTKTTKIGVKLNIQVQDYTGPLNDVNYLFGRVMWASPSQFPVKFPQTEEMNYIPFGNKSGGPQQNMFANPYASLAQGVNAMFRTTSMGTVDFDQKLDFITKGLSVTGQFSLKVFNSTSTGKYITPFYFEIDPNTLIQNDDGSYKYDLRSINTDGSNAAVARNSNSSDRLANANIMLNYHREFGKHDVNAQFIYLQRGYYRNNPASNNYNAALGEKNQGIAGRLTYNFNRRYYTEFNFAYNGSDNFVKGKKFGFFPSIALGYIISNEKFFEPLTKVVSLLKLRGSYGLVGNSLTSERFQGYTHLTMDGKSYSFGPAFNSSMKGAVITRYGNPYATWETSLKKNIGLELGLFDNRFLLIADFFRENRERILLIRQTVPATVGMGSATPFANMGKTRNEGVDLSLEYNHVFNPDFLLTFKGTFTYAKNTLLFRDEPEYEWDYQYERGGPMNRIGPAYVALGLFKDQADIDNSPDQSAVMANVKPGDIKYQDLNGDKKIDQYDRTYIGDPYIPQVVYGFGLSAKYKRWDFSVYFQGIAKVSIYMNDIHPFGVYHKNVLGFVAEDYWSESNPNPDAAYPRLSHTDGRDNTEVLSSYWLRDGAFLRLKNLEIGYSFKWMRVYVSGANLLTFSPFKHWDPELGGYDNKPESSSDNRGNGLRYPLQRIVNIGAQFNF